MMLTRGNLKSSRKERKKERIAANAKRGTAGQEPKPGLAKKAGGKFPLTYQFEIAIKSQLPKPNVGSDKKPVMALELTDDLKSEVQPVTKDHLSAGAIPTIPWK